MPRWRQFLQVSILIVIFTAVLVAYFEGILPQPIRSIFKPYFVWLDNWEFAKPIIGIAAIPAAIRVLHWSSGIAGTINQIKQRNQRTNIQQGAAESLKDIADHPEWQKQHSSARFVLETRIPYVKKFIVDERNRLSAASRRYPSQKAVYGEPHLGTFSELNDPLPENTIDDISDVVRWSELDEVCPVDQWLEEYLRIREKYRERRSSRYELLVSALQDRPESFLRDFDSSSTEYSSGEIIEYLGENAEMFASDVLCNKSAQPLRQNHFHDQLIKCIRQDPIWAEDFDELESYVDTLNRNMDRLAKNNYKIDDREFITCIELLDRKLRKDYSILNSDLDREDL